MSEDPALDGVVAAGRRRRTRRLLAIGGGVAASLALVVLIGWRTSTSDVAIEMGGVDGGTSTTSAPGDELPGGVDVAATSSSPSTVPPSSTTSSLLASSAPIPPGSEAASTAPPAPGPSSPALEPAIVVEPSAGLRRGDLVTITATGYGPRRFFQVGGAGVNAVSPFGSTDRPRSETTDAPFTFTAYVSPWRPDGSACPADGCALEVTVLEWCDCKYGPKEIDRVSVPVAFAPVGEAPPPPTVALVPEGAVALGDTRTVVIDGLFAGEPVRQEEWRCETPSITSPYLPWPATVTELTADAVGRLETTITIAACPVGAPPDRPANRFRFESVLGTAWAHDVAAG